MKVFKPKVDPLAIDLVSKIVVYSPNKRLSALEALAHSYFDDMREEKFVGLNSQRIPNLFNFSESKKI